MINTVIPETAVPSHQVPDAQASIRRTDSALGITKTFLPSTSSIDGRLRLHPLPTVPNRTCH
jgi:hypothetical protein